MEITATSKYDQKTVTALIRVSMFKKLNPKIYIILSATLISFIIIESIFMLLISGGTLHILFLSLSAVLILLICYIYLLLPKIQYRSMSKLAESYNTFRFTDDTVIITTSVGEYNGSCSMAYSMFCRIMETSEYLFLYQNKQQAFVVDKSTVQGGTVNELRAKLVNIPGLKYIHCNY